jgi:hypothetical protein
MQDTITHIKHNTCSTSRAAKRRQRFPSENDGTLNASNIKVILFLGLLSDSVAFGEQDWVLCWTARTFL